MNIAEHHNLYAVKRGVPVFYTDCRVIDDEAVGFDEICVRKAAEKHDREDRSADADL